MEAVGAFRCRAGSIFCRNDAARRRRAKEGRWMFTAGSSRRQADCGRRFGRLAPAAPGTHDVGRRNAGREVHLDALAATHTSQCRRPSDGLAVVTLPGAVLSPMVVPHDGFSDA
jgi:hypothetical protein